MNLDSRSGVDGRDVLRDHAVPVALVVKDGIAVLRCLAVAAGERVAILPEHVSGDALGSQGCRLPRVLDRAVVGSAICFSVCQWLSLLSELWSVLTLFEDAGLVGSRARGAVGSDPEIAPAVRLAPYW